MPRQTKNTLVKLEFFHWKLFRRDGVYYADGRGNKIRLGKHSLGTRDHDEATEILKILDVAKAIELGLATAQSTSAVTQISIKTGWEEFIASRESNQKRNHSSPLTPKRYKSVKENHLAFCKKYGTQNWNEIDKKHLDKYFDLRTDQEYGTIYLELTMIKTVHKWLIREKLIPIDLTIYYPLAKPGGDNRYCYTAQEGQAIIHHCFATPKLKWLGNVVMALSHTGMRIEELAQIRWSAVDLNNATIRIIDERHSSKKLRKVKELRTTKGKKTRIVPIHPRLLQTLQEMDEPHEGYTFVAAKGGKLKQRRVLKIFKEQVIGALKSQFPTPEGELGFEHGVIHSFRHFFCSQAFLSGASEGEVRDWMGHSESKIVERYRHLRPSDSVKRISKIEFLPAE